MNVQQWREMSGYVNRLVAVGATDIVTTIETGDDQLGPYASIRLWFGEEHTDGVPYNDAYLEIGSEAPDERRNTVNYHPWQWHFATAVEAVEFIEACHVAACFALLEAAGFERAPWGEWHKDGCWVKSRRGSSETLFDIYAPDFGPQPNSRFDPFMQRGDGIVWRTFSGLDLQTLLEFKGWPTAEQVAADKESDRLAALLSPEHLAQIDAVLAEVDAGIYPDDGVDADVALEKVRRAVEG